MMRRYLLLVLLIHVGPGRAQFADFLPSFSIFAYTTPRTTRHSIRPKTTQNPYKNEDYLKPASTRKHYVDHVTDKEIKPIIEPVFLYSTEKPIRKTTKRNRGRISNQDTTKDSSNSYKNKQNDFNEVIEEGRDNQRYNIDNNDNYSNNYHKTTHNSYEITTKNPFYDKPGVKPAIIDNRPPITNRPVYKTTTVRATTRRMYVVPPRPTDSGAVMFPDDDITPEVLTGPDEDNMSEVEKQRYVELAEKKCDQYKSSHTTQLQAIPLLPMPEPVQVNVSSCTPTNIPLIVGGTVVSIAEFPHMALLGWPEAKNGGYSWKCGGSLISEQYVLTAGHCTYLERDEITGPPRVVQLGSSYLDDPGALVVRVGSVIRHPKYKPNRSYYDIALLKLSNSVKFSELIRPACLGVPPHAGKHIIATGWGQTKLVGNLSLELRSVSLPVWDIDSCGRALGTSRKMPVGPSKDSQLCAGEPDGGKDTCQGDSGGPAQIQEGCIWRIVAVTSIGRSCAAPNTPGLYSLVHIPFIAAQVFGAHRNKLPNRNTEENHQNSYNTANNNNYGANNEQSYYNTQNNMYDTHGQSNTQNNNNYNTNGQSNTQTDYTNSHTTQNNRQNIHSENNNYNAQNNRHSTQNRHQNDDNNFNTQSSTNYETQNNRGYNDNGNRQNNVRKQENNNQQFTRNNNDHRYNSNDSQNTDGYTNQQNNDNYYRNNQNSQTNQQTNNNYYRNNQNSKTEDSKQQSYDSDQNYKPSYDNDRPIWFT